MLEESGYTREYCERVKQEKEQSLIEILQTENELTAKQLNALYEGYDFSPYRDKGAP